MLTAVMVVSLPALLLVAAVGAPRLLRHAAPALARAPRFATLALMSTALLWVAALVAIGPVIAWVSTGPAWLPEQAAAVCSRCLSAASPLGESTVTLAIPAVLPLALPLLGLAAVAAGLIRESLAVRRARASLATSLAAQAEPCTLLGTRVLLTSDEAPVAYSLPGRAGGIVISRATVQLLDRAELSAVLAHERAHLSQHHHRCLTVLRGVTHFFRSVPGIRAVRDAVPHYLEIAADQAAKAETGATALAAALLKLGQPADLQPARAAGQTTPHAVLHAAGSERIRHLTGQPLPPASRALAVAAGLYAVMLVAIVSAVHLPYVLAVLTGC